MIPPARKEQSLTRPPWSKLLYLIAVVCLVALAIPAVATPGSGKNTRRAGSGTTITAKAAATRLAAKKSKTKKRKGAKSKSRPKPAKSKAKTHGKPNPPKAAGRSATTAGATPLPTARHATGIERNFRPVAPGAMALQRDVGVPAALASSGEGKRLAIPQPARTIVTTAAIDVAALKRAIEMVRNRKSSNANEIKKTIADPIARKLIDWVILRNDDSNSNFADYASFIVANPQWPSIVTLRRKAEAVAWQDRVDPAKVKSFFAQWPPLSAKGRLAYARALLALGDSTRAASLIRNVWRNDSMSQETERRVAEAFGDVLTRADDKARMDRRLYERDDTEAGLRAAQRLGGHQPAIAKARIAARKKDISKAALDSVPTQARDDIGYIFARLQVLRRSNKLAQAVELLHRIPRPLDQSHDLDAWWIQRRVLARELLDVGDAKSAYLVARDATSPTSDYYRAEHQFLAGWIALRFLHDPATAYGHFKHIADGSDNPITRARAAYWLGRAAQALNRTQEAQAHYQEAARYPTAYYGQIARAKAGLGELTLRPLPALTVEQRASVTRADVVRAAELLYVADARDLAWTVMADLGDKSDDSGVLVILAELAAKYRDARGMLLLGRLALARGYTLDHAAFPTIGVPDYKPITSPVEPAIVYSIVRQESWFNPKTVSSANALGLMQVTPDAGRYIAKKYKVKFDKNRLLKDMAYNVQFGAAEIGDNIREYRGSYILAFAAYNAGRGRVKEWISRFGDPRSPGVDPIDWVERIPFSETRNYVQRVMENVQVYRIRFGGSPRLLIEADLRRGSTAN
jgi:soluble lytic murein transglycosylase